ncbi:MAG: type II toxin-antitoxin system VapC family toxin [Thermomicrobiales bacterium]
MRRYLLDTGPLAALLHERPAAVELMQPWLMRQEAATSILVYGEVVEYIRPLPSYWIHYQGLRNLMRAVNPYALSFSVLERYADLRLLMRRPHGTGLVGDIDTLIAATALERNLTVVTIDRAFLRVPDLRVILIDRSTLRVVEDGIE